MGEGVAKEGRVYFYAIMLLCDSMGVKVGNNLYDATETAKQQGSIRGRGDSAGLCDNGVPPWVIQRPLVFTTLANIRLWLRSHTH